MYSSPRSLLGSVLQRITMFRLRIPYVRRISIGGISFKFLIATPEGHRWYGQSKDYGHIEGIATEILLNRANRGCVFVDVGAHHGFYAVAAALLVGEGGRVVAIEPQPTNFRVLVRNVELNRLKNVQAVCAKAGDVDNKRFRRLDTLLEGLEPDIIKIDVEGFENQVISGATRTVSRFKPLIVCELHPMKGAKSAPIIEFLKAQGYQINVARESSPMVLTDVRSDEILRGNDMLIAEPAKSTKNRAPHQLVSGIADTAGGNQF